MLSSSLEKYLILIYELSMKEEEMKCSELARTLNVPLKKVIQALQRMHYQKYISYTAYQPLTITEKGQQMARFLISRDALIEEFLALIQMNMDEEEKDTMKQYLSYEALKAIEQFVAFVRQYPEITNRYKLYLKRNQGESILEPLPNE